MKHYYDFTYDDDEIIVKVINNMTRGYGNMTIAIFQNHLLNKLDYVEIIYANPSEYQRDAHQLNKDDAKSLLLKKIGEIRKDKTLQILQGHFYVQREASALVEKFFSPNYRGMFLIPLDDDYRFCYD